MTSAKFSIILINEYLNKAGTGPACERTNVTRDLPLDDAVRAMGHPGRRAMLRAALDDERSASDLAGVAQLTPQAASLHLKLLRETGLMDVRADATRRLYRVNLTRLAEVRAVLDEMWGNHLDALKAAAEAESPHSARQRGGRTA